VGSSEMSSHTVMFSEFQFWVATKHEYIFSVGGFALLVEPPVHHGMP